MLLESIRSYKEHTFGSLMSSRIAPITFPVLLVSGIFVCDLSNFFSLREKYPECPVRDIDHMIEDFSFFSLVVFRVLQVIVGGYNAGSDEDY